MRKKTLLGSNQEIGSQNEAKKICRAQHVEIQKSTFHPPLTKGERGGFDESWRFCVFAGVVGVSDCIVPNGFKISNIFG